MPSRNNRYLVGKSVVSFLGEGGGAVAGVVLDATVLAMFGVGVETDALFAALALPVLLTGTLEVQAPKVLVPVLLRAHATDNATAMGRLLLALGVVVASLLTLVAWAGSWGAGWLTAVLVPGFTFETRVLTSDLSQIVFWLVPLRGLAAILHSALLARHVYAVPSLSRAISQLTALGWILFAPSTLLIHDVGVGFLVGASTSLIVLVGSLLYHGVYPGLPGRDHLRAAWRALALLPVPLVGQGLGEARLLLENFLTSLLAPGALSSVRYASRIATALGRMVVGSVVRAALPLLSESVAKGDQRELSERLAAALRMVLLLGGVICAWLVFCGYPLISILFARGRFQGGEAWVVAVLVVLMVPSIVLGRVLGVVQLPFYAKATMWPTLVGSIISLPAFAVVGPPALWVVGVYGLPLARFVTLAAAVYVTYRLARTRFDLQLQWRRVLVAPTQVSAGFASACAVGAVFVWWMPFALVQTDLARIAIPSLLGAAVLLVSMKSALGVGSVRQLRELLATSTGDAL